MLPSRFTGLWRHRDFVKLWSGQTISMFGSLVGRFALSLTAIIALDATPVEISMLRIAEMVPVILVGLFAGAWIDRVRRRPVMIAADLGRALALASVPIAALLGVLRIEHLIAVVVVMSVFNLVFEVAYRAYLPSLIRRDQLVEGNSKLQASNSVAEVSAFGLAGVFVQILSAPVTLLVDALSFLASAFSLSLIRAPDSTPKPRDDRQSTFAEVRSGLWTVYEDRVLRAFAGVEGTRQFFGNGMLSTVLGLFLIRDLNLEPVVMGVIFSLGGVSALFGAVLAGRITRRWGVGRAMVASLALSSIAMLFIPMAGGTLVLILVFLSLQQLLGDGAAIVYEIGETSLIQSVTPDHVLGRVVASMRFVGWGCMLLGAFAGGVLGETIGLRETLYVAAFGGTFAVLWLALSPVRGLREYSSGVPETAPSQSGG
jgi:MFS family permease